MGLHELWMLVNRQHVRGVAAQHDGPVGTDEKSVCDAVENIMAERLVWVVC